MSKVYEALRQKEQELSGAVAPVFEFGGDSSVAATVPSDDVFGIADSTLRTALGGEERGVRQESIPPFSMTFDQAADARTSQINYRDLKLSPSVNSRLVFQNSPHGAAAEQFRFLRRNLERKFPNGGILLITSPAPRDGKTLTSLNLCTCLADSGRSTLLIEGDIRQPSVGKVLGVSNEGPGVEDILAGAVEPDRVIQSIDELSLQVAMVAVPPSEPARLVSGPGVKKFLGWARSRFHWVVIDSPPVVPAADVAQLAPLADATLLVVRAQCTSRDSILKAVELLGDHLAGVVMNDASMESKPYYRYLAQYRENSAGREKPAAPNGPGSCVENGRIAPKVQ